MAFTLEQEQSLLALLEEKKITLSELPAATDLIEDDLILMRQGIIDKSVNNGVLKRYFTPPASSLTESGIVKLSSAIDSTNEHTAATSKAVKVSYDLAITANKNANSRLLATEAAVAADKLTIPRFISGVSFDGTTDIVLSAGNVGAYTKTESDIRYQIKGNYTPAGQAYTKAESDTRYQIKGNYTPAGQAYTKAESEARYVQYMRLGSQITTDYIAGYNDIPGGCVVTGIDVSGDNASSASIRYRPIQILINGQWLNIGGL